jgi:two-component system, OmpR family, sensor histidine kinase CpxA
MFSKAGVQESPRGLVPVDVEDALRQAIAGEGARVELAVDNGLMATADPEYLIRSVSNLLRNAVRYAGEAGPIEVTARRERSEAVICVADRGPGLPPGEAERVFTPFYRIENSRNRETGGVGLGLSIVRDCVTACRGTVLCRNRTPSGLEVEIRLRAA